MNGALPPDEKGDIAEDGLEQIFNLLRVRYAPFDAALESEALLARGPDDKIRCPDYLAFDPFGLHEAKFREYLRDWEPDDGECDERVYITKERWDDYCQHAEWHPVTLWIYVDNRSAWLWGSVGDLSPADDGVIKDKDEYGMVEEIDVCWFSATQFQILSL